MFLRKACVFNVSTLKSILKQESSFVNIMTRAKIMNQNVLKNCSTLAVTSNITLSSRQAVVPSSKVNSLPVVDLKQSRPLIVLLEYMNAQKKHVKKIVDVYLDRGFDVLQICLKPFQLLFPARGSQVVAKDLADFLLVNKSFSPLIIHGFSVGGYVWGETLVHFKEDINNYQSVVDRIKGQIFDSPADLEAIPTAFPSSVFPNNSLLKSTFQKYLSFHLKVCNEISTKHYKKSREAFTSGLVTAPSLFITSNADILSSPESVFKARDEIIQKNLETEVKIFDGSPHVMHFRSYPNEYVAEIDNFLKKIGLDYPVPMKAKL